MKRLREEYRTYPHSTEGENIEIGGGGGDFRYMVGVASTLGLGNSVETSLHALFRSSQLR